MLQELKASGESIADLAGHLGEGPARLQRILHGQTPADLGGVMAWALRYGIHILPVFDASSELKPT